MQARYIADFSSDFDDASLKIFITKYLSDEKIDMNEKVKNVEVAWRTIEEEFLRRIERIFEIKEQIDLIRIYLTTDTRCSYNTEQGYFFVSISRMGQNKTIMHELMHFWTWWKFHDEVESGRLTKGRYNDIKESLTELLNLECEDLLGDIRDGGYPQHKEMRALIRKEWLKTKNIKQVFVVAMRYA
jgi:hypothetical protein